MRKISRYHDRRDDQLRRVKCPSRLVFWTEKVLWWPSLSRSGFSGVIGVCSSPTLVISSSGSSIICDRSCFLKWYAQLNFMLILLLSGVCRVRVTKQVNYDLSTSVFDVFNPRFHISYSTRCLSPRTKYRRSMQQIPNFIFKIDSSLLTPLLHQQLRL